MMRPGPGGHPKRPWFSYSLGIMGLNGRIFRFPRSCVADDSRRARRRPHGVQAVELNSLLVSMEDRLRRFFGGRATLQLQLFEGAAAEARVIFRVEERNEIRAEYQWTGTPV